MRRLGVVAIAKPSNGGTFQYTLSMLEALRHLQGWDLTLYSAIDNEHYNAAGFPIRSIDLSRRKLLALVIADICGASMMDPFDKEDVVLAPIYSPYLLHTRKPFAYTLHDLQERYYPENFSIPQRAWRNHIQTRLTRLAARIICESRFVQQDIVRFFGIPAKKVRVMPAPPLLSKDDGNDLARLEALRVKYALPPMYLFYPAAQFWPHKNHLRLVEAFARIAAEFPHCHLVLTGRKTGDYYRVFRRACDLGIEGRVQYIGYVEQEDLFAIYRGAIGLVMPSLFESVSTPVYEAFQAGIPVCASDVVALPEQIGDAGLLFDPLSVESMGESMRSLLNDRALRMRLVENGRKRFSSMTYEKYGESLQALLNELSV